MIEVKGLTKTYGKQTVVDSLDFMLETGKTLALIGTSGSGKTTVLKMLNRLVEPSSGKVWLNGESMLELSVTDMRRKIGYVIQDTGLFPHYSIEENISVVPKLLKWEPERIQERVKQLMDKLGLPYERHAHKYPSQLSGGQQQRVGIARALAADPPMILMDEPFGALDTITRRSIRQEFMDLEELASKTTIIVTHDIEEAFEMGDEVLLLHNGKKQQLGSPNDLLFEPANEFVVEFLAAQRLQLEFEVVRLKDLYQDITSLTSQTYSEVLSLEPHEKVFTAISHVMRSEADKVALRVQHNGSEKVFTLSALMEAFYRLVKNEN